MKTKPKQEKQDQAVKPEYPKVLETFYDVGDYELNRMKVKEPTSFNCNVRVKRYRITVEEIEEPKEVYAERLQKLWTESDNFHHYHPIMNTAKRMGIELNRDDYGKNRKEF